MIKSWSDEAWEDFEYWTKEDRKTLKRILQLLKDIDRNGYEGLGKPEPLRGDLSSYWSRRIDECNRLVCCTESPEMLRRSFHTGYYSRWQSGTAD